MFAYAESGIRPETIDTTSSGVYNYVRRNIREEQREEEGELVTVFVYEEEKVRKENWEDHQKVEQQRADIDFIAMETGVDL